MHAWLRFKLAPCSPNSIVVLHLLGKVCVSCHAMQPRLIGRHLAAFSQSVVCFNLLDMFMNLCYVCVFNAIIKAIFANVFAS